MERLPFEQKFVKYELALENAISNNFIAGELAVYGYGIEKLKEGKSLYDEAKLLYIQQQDKYARQYESTQDLKKTLKEADKTYKKTLKIAKIAYEEDVKAKSSLLLTGERKSGNMGWMDEAQRFYSHFASGKKADGNIDVIDSEKIKKFGYTDEKLSNEYEMVKKVIAMNMKQKQATGEAQEMTEKRDAVIKKLDKWMNDYIKVARITFEENKQVLEQLGIVVKNTRKKKDTTEEDTELTPLLENK